MNKLVFSIIAISILGSLANAQSTTSAQQKKCANKVLSAMKDVFAAELSSIDDESFTVARISLSSVETIKYNSKNQILTVTAKLSAAKIRTAYSGKAKLSADECSVDSKSIESIELDNEGFIFQN